MEMVQRKTVYIRPVIYPSSSRVAGVVSLSIFLGSIDASVQSCLHKLIFTVCHNFCMDVQKLDLS